MAMGKRHGEGQESFRIPTADLQRTPGHPFYERLKDTCPDGVTGAVDSVQLSVGTGACPSAHGRGHRKQNPATTNQDANGEK